MQRNHPMLAQLTAHLCETLTEAQKVRLLCDIHSLDDPAMNALGVPRVRLARVKADGLPPLCALSRSWDPALMGDVTAAMVTATMEAGAECVILPGAAVADGSAFVGASVQGGAPMTEDPYLSGILAGACLRGSHDRPVLVEGYGETGADKEAAVRELFILRPWRTALADGDSLGVVIDGDSEPVWSARIPTVRRRADERGTVQALVRGEICFSGSEAALQAALHNYRRLCDAVTHGKVTTGELEAAVTAGDAISPEMLRDAIGRLLSFALSCSEASDTNADDAMSGEKIANSSANIHGSGEQISKKQANTTESGESRRIQSEQTIGRTQTFKENAPLVIRAMEGATVLLDNRRGLLPLEASKRVALIGALTAEEISDATRRLEAAGHTVVGAEPGMSADGTERRDDLVTRAALLAGNAEVVLLFPGTAVMRRRRAEALPRLSAGARALCDAVCAAGHPVVLILGDAAIDPTFLTHQTAMPAAVLSAPLSVRGGAAHAVETVLGHRAPAGRLTAAIPTGEADALRDGYRRGPFVGYRYYDTVGFGMAYPFGHGLTYTKFRYSRLSVTPSEVRFTVQNVGRRPGVAIPQVYAGASNGDGETTPLDDLLSVARSLVDHTGIERLKALVAAKAPDTPSVMPRRELVAHTVVALAPGESREIILPWSPLRAYSATYTVSVGESVTDIRLTGGAVIPGGEPGHDGELSAYLPTVSNIETEHYTLEATVKPMKSSLRNLVFGIAALVMAVSLKIYNIASVSDAVFLDILSVALAAGATVFFVLEWTERRRESARRQAELDALRVELFADAEHIPMPSAEALFDAEQDPAFMSEWYTADSTDEAPAHTDAAPAVYDYFADVDKDVTLSVAAGELCALAAERGVALDAATAQSVLASIMTSRLIVVRDMTDEAFDSLLGVLCEYFGCPVAADRVDGTYTDETAVLGGARTVEPPVTTAEPTATTTEVTDAPTEAIPASETPVEVPTEMPTEEGTTPADGEQSPVTAPVTESAVPPAAPRERRLLRALNAADRDIRHIHIGALCDVRWETVSAYFVPFARYARMPHGQVSVMTRTEGGESATRTLPENLWFILRLADGETLRDMPDYIAEVATVHRWNVGITTAEPPAERATYHPFTYGQVLYMADRLRADFALDEEIWKQFDRLVTYAARYSSFRMSNKLWLGLESYIAALLDMGTARAAALDEAMAVGLLPVLIPALNGKLTRDDRRLSETLDALFGDGETPLCHRTIKQSGADLV